MGNRRNNTRKLLLLRAHDALFGSICHVAKKSYLIYFVKMRRAYSVKYAQDHYVSLRFGNCPCTGFYHKLYVCFCLHFWPGGYGWITVLNLPRTNEEKKYGQTAHLRHTKSQNFNISRLVLHLDLPNPLKSGVQSRMKVKLEQRR